VITQYDGYSGTWLALYYWHTDTSCGGPDRAMHIRTLAGANVVHLFIFCRTILLFLVAHVGDLSLFLKGFSHAFNACQCYHCRPRRAGGTCINTNQSCIQCYHCRDAIYRVPTVDSMVPMWNQCQTRRIFFAPLRDPIGNALFLVRPYFHTHQLSSSSSALAVASSSSPLPSLASVSPAQARHAQVSLRPSDAATRSAAASSW
jgi:hypothetical protein